MTGVSPVTISYGEQIVDNQLGKYHHLISVSEGIFEGLKRIAGSYYLRKYTVQLGMADISVEVSYSAVEPAPLAVTVTVVTSPGDDPNTPRLNLRSMAASLGKAAALAGFVYGPVRPLSDGSNGVTFNLARI
jgi:hypothetical protein